MLTSMTSFRNYLVFGYLLSEVAPLLDISWCTGVPTLSGIVFISLLISLLILTITNLISTNSAILHLAKCSVTRRKYNNYLDGPLYYVVISLLLVSNRMDL